MSSIKGAANLVGGKLRRESGMVLLVVLVILLVVASSSASFIWFMNQQQTRAGTRFRTAAAMAVAEAGVHRALSILESVAPNGTPGRFWRPAAHSEILPVATLEGRFTLSAADEAGGAIVVTSAGEVGGVTRRLRARVYLASPALLAALYGAGHVRLERSPAALLILPYGIGATNRPWTHVAVGRGIGFMTDVSINDPSVPFEAGPGPLDIPGGTSSPAPAAIDHIRLLLARGADVTVGPENSRIDVRQLRTMGVRMDGTVARAEAFPRAPDVDRAFFQGQAGANTANAGLNEAAGKYTRDEELAQKADSLYSQKQFERLLAYLLSVLDPPSLRGVIYVRGEVTLFERQTVRISDGALITEDTLHLTQAATLEVTHTAATRTLPGLLVLGNGSLIVNRQARLRVHGLVYVNRVIDVWDGARVDAVGALLARNRGISFRNIGARVMIRYDPGVLGTPGLRVHRNSPLVAWVATWEELP